MIFSLVIVPRALKNIPSRRQPHQPQRCTFQAKRTLFVFAFGALLLSSMGFWPVGTSPV
jgi:hypothetical protein